MTEKSRGGPRDGAGRKHIKGTKPIMKSVKLSSEHWAKAGKIGRSKAGKPNAAEGIRKALDEFPTEDNGPGTD